MKKIFLIVGRTGSGKSSITRAACEQLGLRVVKSYTTRPPRPNELDGPCDHYFITEEEVSQYENEIIAYTEINGYKYFTTKSELDQCDAYVIDPRGIEYLKDKCGGEYKFVTVYVRTSPEITRKRVESRGDDLEVFQKRSTDEDDQFRQFEKDMAWDYHLLNNDSFERAVETMSKFMKREFYL